MVNRRALLLAAAPILAAGQAFADDKDDDDDRRGRATRNDLRQEFQEGRVRRLDEILGQAQSRMGGSVIEAELKRERGSYVYKLKVLAPDGRVTEVRLDAATGNEVQR